MSKGSNACQRPVTIPSAPVPFSLSQLLFSQSPDLPLILMLLSLHLLVLVSLSVCLSSVCLSLPSPQPSPVWWAHGWWDVQLALMIRCPGLLGTEGSCPAQVSLVLSRAWNLEFHETLEIASTKGHTQRQEGSPPQSQ